MYNIELGYKTNPDWTQIILDNFDIFLADHADCERKASAMAMNFVAKCPDKIQMIKPLINLALEELRHFKQVYEIMSDRGIALNVKMHDDPYINKLLALCKSTSRERLLDRLIVASLVEARGAERFGILADALTDIFLKEFYYNLFVAEQKHGQVFIKLAGMHYSELEINPRLSFFIEQEASIIQSLEWRPSLH
ncbi:MAG: tRNA-(ms[2]io[6]A)-hydroxylase [Candidatus Omnitrophota bacterium]|jgi:tRNA-(ms[2]io[6]A)-hydroxylase